MKKYLCAVQMKWSIKNYQDIETFESKIESFLEPIRQKMQQGDIALVAFPEDIGAPLLFLKDYQRIKNCRSLHQAVKKMLQIHLLKVLQYRIKYRVGWIRALALVRAFDAGRIYFNVFSKVAMKYGLYIAAGSVLLPDFKLGEYPVDIDYILSGGEVYNTCYLFSPEGRIIGKQKKAYLVSPLEDKDGFDLCCGSIEELQTYETPFGKLGIGICLDSFQEPVIKTLAAMGADILIQPSANSRNWDREQQSDWMTGCWKAMKNQQDINYAINPMMTGCLFDLCFEGQSSILSNKNNSMTQVGYKDLDPAPGFLKIAHSYNEEEVLMVTMEQDV